MLSVRSFLAMWIFGILFAQELIAREPFSRDPDINFTEFRTEFGWRDDYRSFCEEDRPSEEMIAAVNAQDPERILDVTLPWLSQCPVDIQAHMFALVGYSIPEPNEEGLIHLEWYEGLIESILASGDGESSETAFETISIAETRALLVYLKLEPIRQALVGDPMRDLITVRDVGGNEKNVWFNPAAHFYRLAKWTKEIVKEIDK